MASVLRRRKNERHYARHRKHLGEGICEFCEFTPTSKQVTRAGTHFWVVATKFIYDMWDSYGVDDHLMLVPKRHIRSFKEFTSVEQEEFFELVSYYDTKQYSIYTRPMDSKTKSIAHHHTHLIKLDARPKRFIFYLRKPHILFMR